MKAIKIISAIAAMFCASLILLLTTSQDPVEKQFNLTVQSIMEFNGYNTENEVLQFYPELEDIKVQIKYMQKCEFDIRQVTMHPIPPDREEGEQLLRRMDTLRQLRSEVMEKLKRIRAYPKRVTAEYP